MSDTRDRTTYGIAYQGSEITGADRKARYVLTGEVRTPRKGEFYLSGAIPEIYKAPANLSDTYRIARKVEDGKPDWAEVPQSEIDKELAFLRREHPKRTEAWLVTCRYDDGTATCQACIEFPYSDTSRKLYRLDWRRS